MGLFSKTTYECKLCEKTVERTNYVSDIGICNGCALVLDVDVKSMSEIIAEYQEKANTATDPNDKVKYLSVMLEWLYKYKIKYYDNDVDVIEQDIYEMISDVIDAISCARE